MRELHAWHGDRRRHSPDAAADAHVVRAHDPPNREILRDPAARIAKHLEYRKVVEAAEARSTADQFKRKEARLEHTPAETPMHSKYPREGGTRLPRVSLARSRPA
jgi:hypothetical protein